MSAYTSSGGSFLLFIPVYFIAMGPVYKMYLQISFMRDCAATGYLVIKDAMRLYAHAKSGRVRITNHNNDPPTDCAS
eukprot:2121383-Amphidinium_carterae.1